MPSDRCRFVRNTFHQVAVAAESVNAVVKHVVSVTVETGIQPALRNRESYGVADALAEWAGGCFHSGSKTVFGMPGRLGTPLAKLLNIIEGQIEARQIQHGIEQHRGVSVG